MLKKIASILVLTMMLGLLSSCTGTTVVYQTNNYYAAPTAAPTEEQTDADTGATGEAASEESPVQDTDDAQTGALKTGLAISGSAAESASATAEAAGQAKYDVTVAAVTVDDNGVIRSCIVDSLPATVTFDAAGQITSDISAALRTKDEQGEDYGMKKYAGAKYEWNEQIDALEQYAVGKTVEELKSGAVNESGKAADVDLAATATIALGGYVSAIEAAVANAQDLGAQEGDELKLAIIGSTGSSTSATAEAAGLSQLDVDVAVVTMNGDVITSCAIDSLQAKVNFDAAGALTTDLTAPMLTKNALGENYGMKKYAGAKYEWNEQAASFAAYVTGKTAADVAGIAVTEKTAPAEADLSASVTIAIGGFQALIAKAAQ